MLCRYNVCMCKCVCRNIPRIHSTTSSLYVLCILSQVYGYIYIYIYIYAHTQTHTHTRRKPITLQQNMMSSFAVLHVLLATEVGCIHTCIHAQHEYLGRYGIPLTWSKSNGWEAGCEEAWAYICCNLCCVYYVCMCVCIHFVLCMHTFCIELAKRAWAYIHTDAHSLCFVLACMLVC